MAESDEEKKDVSIHILPTAANLLGICFLVFSLISVLKLGDQTLYRRSSARHLPHFSYFLTEGVIFLLWRPSNRHTG
jgi:hypothetical protein